MMFTEQSNLFCNCRKERKYTMSVSTAKKIMKVLGVLSVIAALFVFILAAVILRAGDSIAANPDISEEVRKFFESSKERNESAVSLITAGLLHLIEGTCSLRATKNSSKYKGAWIFALLGLVLGTVGIVISLAARETQSISDEVISLAISLLTFIAANTIRKDALGK